MKRLFPALVLLLFAPRLAEANACVSSSACATACDFSAAASWTTCGGTAPKPTDVWTIQAGHTVVLGASLSTRAGTVNGTFLTAPDTGVALTLLGAAGNELTIGTGGLFQMRKGDSLICDSTSAPCQYAWDSGGKLDLQGDVHETTMTGTLTDLAADTSFPTCGGTAGRRWTFHVASGSEFAAVGGRVRFLSGRARDREFEIVDVTGSAITICTALTDAASTGTYGGQRLTPHAPIGTLATRHTVPTVTDNTSPWYASPSSGDQVAIIQDVNLLQIGGTRGFRFTDLALTGGTVPPTLRAAHVAGAGTAETGSVAFVAKAAAPGLSAGTFEYLNWHDYRGADQLTLLGWVDTTVRRSSFHDAGPNATDASGPIYPGASSTANGDLPCDRFDIIDNTIYRVRGNGIQYNFGGSLVYSTGGVVQGNLIFDGCTTTNGECSGIEIDACQFCDVSYNVVHDICRVNGGSGDLIRLGGPGAPSLSRGTVAHHNWAVNGCGNGLRSNPGIPGQGRDTTWTANYISHVRQDGGQNGSWYGNVVKNWGLANNNFHAGINNPEKALGNWLLGNDPTIGGGIRCATGCSRDGILFDASGGNGPGASGVLVQDLFVGGLDSPVVQNGGVRIDSGSNYDVDVDHVTCDDFGVCGTCIKSASSSAIAVTVTDVAAERFNQCTAVVCSAPTVETVGNLAYTSSGVAANDVSVDNTDCDSTGTWTPLATLGYVDPSNGNFNFVPNAPGRTLGQGATPIGLRAFRHPGGEINAFWGGILPFDLMQPADVANVSNADSDDDGVMDFIDNCASVADPSQFDLDGDGFGDACDCAPGDASAWDLPGEATGLLLSPVSGPATTRLDWTAPSTGGLPVSMTYDVIRSTRASDLVASATCLASGLSVTTATDLELPGAGSAFFYVVRASDVCGAGVAHRGSNGLPVPARQCLPAPLGGVTPPSTRNSR
ncbi:MAG TPA: right-handed parallel beta-helix repeat-containing protein [Candidatus Polarisedimenticolia bacterium]|nr:right-handed parallel beta-helix repeat-containing protein [Candidatus Polarisedimenticolia bacterium]